MKRKLIVLLVLIILAFADYKYIYQDHRDIQKEQAEFIVSSSVIFNEFSLNSFEAEKKYFDKIIEITGTITEVNQYEFTLNNIISCQFDSIIENSIKVNQKVTIKGFFLGYDDLIEQVKLNQCSVIK